MSEKRDLSTMVCIRCGKVKDADEHLACDGCRGKDEAKKRHLEALKDGKEVLCTVCEKPIPSARLEAAPGCVRCVKCQEKHDADHEDDQIAGVMVYDNKTGGDLLIVRKADHGQWRDRPKQDEGDE